MGPGRRLAISDVVSSPGIGTVGVEQPRLGISLLDRLSSHQHHILSEDRWSVTYRTWVQVGRIDIHIVVVDVFALCRQVGPERRLDDRKVLDHDVVRVPERQAHGSGKSAGRLPLSTHLVDAVLTGHRHFLGPLRTHTIPDRCRPVLPCHDRRGQSRSP